MKRMNILVLLVVISFNSIGNELNKAIEAGLRTKVGMLLEKNIDINEVDENDQTAINVAILKKDEIIFDLILNENPDINKTNFKGQTALQLAIENSFSYGIKKLIDKNPDLEIKDIEGRTALVYAIRKNNRNLIETLIKKGSNINCIDKYSNTILHILVKTDDNVELVKYFINKGIDINNVNLDKKTALHISIENKANNISELLINSNININLFDNNGQTPLHLAIINNSPVLRNLLEKKAIADIQDNNNKTAFDYLVSTKEIGKIWNSLFKTECLKNNDIELNEFLHYSSKFYYYLDIQGAIESALNFNNKSTFFFFLFEVELINYYKISTSLDLTTNTSSSIISKINLKLET